MRDFAQEMRGGGQEGHSSVRQSRHTDVSIASQNLFTKHSTPSLNTQTQAVNTTFRQLSINNTYSIDQLSPISSTDLPTLHYSIPPVLPTPARGAVRFATINILGAHTSSGECKILLAARVAVREKIDIMVLTETGMSKSVHISAALAIQRETGYSMVTTKNYRPWPNTPAHHSGTIMLIHHNWFTHMGKAKTVGDRVLILPFHFRKSTIWVVGMYQFTSPHSTNRQRAKQLIQETTNQLSSLLNNDLNQFVLLGDINETMNPELDRLSTPKTRSHQHHNPPMLTPLLEALGLVDAFRCINPSVESYTFSGPSGSSRLDYIFVPDHWIGTTSLASHNEILELTTDHYMVSSDINISVLTPPKSTISIQVEGLQPTGIRIKKGADPSSWTIFHHLSESAFAELLLSPPTPNLLHSPDTQWEEFSNIITEASKSSVSRPNRIFNKVLIHPCKVYKGEPELLLLRQIRQNSKTRATHLCQGLSYRSTFPEFEIVNEGPEPNQLLVSNWPIPVRDQSLPHYERSLSEWWDWVDHRIATLSSLLRSKREKLKRRRIQAAVEARCAKMATNLQSSLRSLLERPFSRPSARLLRTLVNNEIDYISDWEEVEEHIKETFQTWSCTRAPDIQSLLDIPLWTEIYRPPIQPTPLHNITYPITSKEMNRAVSSSKGGKSPGPSGVSYEVLKHLGKHGRKVLLQVLNSILTNGHIPSSWKHHHIVPIPKGPWEGDYNSTRPISLLETSRKILESVLNFRIRNKLEKFPYLLSGGNFGFVPGDGIEGALSTIREVIEDASESNQELWIAQQDIR